MYIYTYIYIYIYIYIIYITYIYTNLRVSAVVRLPHPRSRDSQGQEIFLAPSADKQTGNYDARMLKPLSLPINAKVKRLSRNKMKW